MRKPLYLIMAVDISRGYGFSKEDDKARSEG